MISTQKYDGLMICALTPEQHARTCDYWYTVTTHGFTTHTAFTTRGALLGWLHERGLTIDDSAIPEQGKHAVVPVKGAYRTAMHLGSYDGFFALRGRRTKVMSNASVTLAIITDDEDGLKTVHYLNPNMQDRPVFPWSDLPE